MINLKMQNCFYNEGYGWCGTYMNDDISQPEFDIQADNGNFFFHFKTIFTDNK